MGYKPKVDMYNNRELNDTSQQEIALSATQNLEGYSSEDMASSEERAEELRKFYVQSRLPEGFYYDEDGWLNFQKEMPEKDQEQSIKICSHIEVIARSRDQYAENHGRLLMFPDPDGVMHKWLMPMELLAGDGMAYRQELLSKGLIIAPVKSARQLLTTFIQISAPDRTVRCVNQTGWNEDRTAFVLHDKTIGQAGSESIILQTNSALSATHKSMGNLSEWKEIPRLCLGNSRLIFALSAAFAGPLLLLLGAENGGIYFRGGSSSGKTTCLRVAASVWGGVDYMQQWRATANGLEGIAVAHNDGLLCLDEMGQIDPAEIGNVAYMLANGIGKTRADKLGDSRKRKNFFFLLEK